MKQGQVEEHFLACPNYDCRVPFSMNELEAILGQAEVAKLRELRLVSTVNRDPHRCWCPNPCCGDIVSIRSTRASKKARRAQCTSCEATFCSRCGGEPHRGTCPRDASYTAWVASGNKNRVKPCPQCHHHIEKQGEHFSTASGPDDCYLRRSSTK